MDTTLITYWVQSNSKSARWKDFPFPQFFILYFISYCKKKLRLYIENLKFAIPTTRKNRQHNSQNNFQLFKLLNIKKHKWKNIIYI